MSVCTIHLIRHAEHGLLGRTLAGRTPGVGLSDTGRAQAAALASHYRDLPIRAVLASPLQRAQETADPIARALTIPVVVTPALDEVDFGRWAGMEFDGLAKAPGWSAWNATRSLAPTPGGELMVSAQARAVTALMQLRLQGGCVVAVSHSDVIKAVLAYILGMPLDLLHRLDIVPAGRSIIVLGEDFARVEGVNLPV